MKKFFTKFINVLSVIIIIVSLFVLLLVITTEKDKAPSVLGYSMFTVMTGSMEPEIGEGNLIVTGPVDIEDIAVGDIISFYSKDPALDGAVNTHRVAWTEEVDGRIILHTKGDANNIEDRYTVNSDNLIGKVVFCSDIFGKVIAILSNPIVFIPLVLLPLFIIIIINIVKTFKLAKKIAREEEEQEKQQMIERLKEIQEKRRKSEEELLNAKKELEDAKKEYSDALALNETETKDSE